MVRDATETAAFGSGKFGFGGLKDSREMSWYDIENSSR